jgi:ketosteroid isomerase-like protein
MNAPGSCASPGADIVAELARRFQAGDSAGAFGLFHPGIRIEQPASLPHGGWHRGHQGVTAMGAAFGRVWSRSIAGPRILGCGESVVQVTTQTWTAHATGRSATVDVVELFSFRDGLVSEIRVFQQDTHLLLATLDRPEG